MGILVILSILSLKVYVVYKYQIHQLMNGNLSITHIKTYKNGKRNLIRKLKGLETNAMRIIS